MSDFKLSATMMEYPFYYEGITQDEYISESHYYNCCVANRFRDGKYQSLRQQLAKGLIKEIPKEYKQFCLNPDWDKGL